ncbi:hypothetical protein HYW21_02485 [Candidatus Woesearchaeota archaeon]|nr:hypothetical protein [Candidatus Woesearchaeota archaeon]
MDQDILSKKRGEVIEKFINCEHLINIIISQHYFKKIEYSFFFDVLYDEYFGFALKRRILEKIVPDLDKAKIQTLNRLNTIRNYFAHCSQQFFEGHKKPDPTAGGFVPNHKDTKKRLDLEELYDEFIKKEPEVTKYLGEIYRKLGGILIPVRNE